MNATDDDRHKNHAVRDALEVVGEGRHGNAPNSRAARTFLRAGIGFEFEEVAGLAAENLADCLQGRETDRTRLAGL